jgi:hypothetical protein
MPIRIRWNSKEYFGIALMLLGACGLFQLIFIFVAQYFLSVGNYLAIILIPIGVSMALFFAVIIIFESYSQVERKVKLKGQFWKLKAKHAKLSKFFEFPIVKPLLIIFVIFSALYFISYAICVIFLDKILSFIVAENLATITCLLVSNYFEKNVAKIQRL